MKKITINELFNLIPYKKNYIVLIRDGFYCCEVLPSWVDEDESFSLISPEGYECNYYCNILITSVSFEGVGIDPSYVDTEGKKGIHALWKREVNEF